MVGSSGRLGSSEVEASEGHQREPCATQGTHSRILANFWPSLSISISISCILDVYCSQGASPEVNQSWAMGGAQVTRGANILLTPCSERVQSVSEAGPPKTLSVALSRSRSLLPSSRRDEVGLIKNSLLGRVTTKLTRNYLTVK